MKGLAKTKTRIYAGQKTLFRFYFGFALIASGVATLILGLFLKN